jgi:hypothetical protein
MKKWKNLRYLSAYILFTFTFLYAQGIASASTSDDLQSCYNDCIDNPPKVSHSPLTNINKCNFNCDKKYKKQNSQKMM